MTWLPTEAAGPDAFQRVFALRPNLFAAWRDFTALLWERSGVEPALLELCRLRIGQMHGAEVPAVCDAMRAARAALPARQVAELASWWGSTAFSETERAALRFAEQFVLDPKDITDADAAALVGALGDAGMVAFVEALAILDGSSRFARFLDAGGAP